MSDDSAFSFKRLLVGKPIPSSLAHHERLSRVTGLAVLSSDALSSVAYATDFILATLVVAGVAAFTYAIPISLVIAALLAIVAFSYRQTIHAYPTGGGVTSSPRRTSGRCPASRRRVALVDYTLTVSVISAGVLAITSCSRGSTCFASRCSSVPAVLMVGNLRGIRESGESSPSRRIFVCAIGVLLLAGFSYATAPRARERPTAAQRRSRAADDVPSLTAFANGRTAMTGVEAVSNGVPAFRPPESKNASATLVTMAVLAIGMFVGITVLAHAYSVIPSAAESGVSQLGRAIFGVSPVYYLIQAGTTLILVLAANTAYADFPRLASIVARDGYLPRQFMNQGDRLAFSNGILVLSVFAAILIIVFAATRNSLPFT
jgi:amino acid transporter